MALRAVRSVFAQDYSGIIECIVVGDGEEPLHLDIEHGTTRVLRTTTNRGRAGPAATRNAGVALARYDVIAFCDDDDEWLPNKLRHQVRLLETRRGAAMVACGIWIFDGAGRCVQRIPPSTLSLAQVYESRHMEVNPSTLVVRRGTLAEPLFDENIPGGRAEDYDLVLRAAAYGPIHNVPDCLAVIHRHSAESYTGRPLGFAEAHEYLLRKHPGLMQSRRAFQRLASLIALSYAFEGNRGAARSWAFRSLRRGAPNLRASLALLASGGFVNLRALQALAVRAGRSLL
jgi:glycosyltransferase involved in cell wall biosynthesis